MPKFTVTVIFEMDKASQDDADQMVDTILDTGLNNKDKSTKLIKVRIEKREKS
jgi:hypothetical protein